MSRAIEAVFYTTAVRVAVTSPAKDSLRRRIMRAGDPSISMADVVNKWVEEGKEVNPVELQQSVRVLRQYRRCRHALQVLFLSVMCL